MTGFRAGALGSVPGFRIKGWTSSADFHSHISGQFPIHVQAHASPKEDYSNSLQGCLS